MDNDTTFKRCTKCGNEYPATREYFSKHGQGLHPQCKTCRRAEGKEYYKKNREKVLDRTAKYAQEHPELRREIQTRRRENHREEVNAYAREWMREWRANATDEDKQKMRETQKRYRASHPEVNRAGLRRHYQKHKPYYTAKTHKRRAIKKQVEGTYSASDIRDLYRSQKGRCWWCGKLVGDDYHVDHRIPLDKGGSNWPENLCISCPECNLSKGNKLPHEWRGRLL